MSVMGDFRPSAKSWPLAGHSPWFRSRDQLIRSGRASSYTRLAPLPQLSEDVPGCRHSAEVALSAVPSAEDFLQVVRGHVHGVRVERVNPEHRHVRLLSDELGDGLPVLHEQLNVQAVGPELLYAGDLPDPVLGLVTRWPHHEVVQRYVILLAPGARHPESRGGGPGDSHLEEVPLQ